MHRVIHTTCPNGVDDKLHKAFHALIDYNVTGKHAEMSTLHR